METPEERVKNVGWATGVWEEGGEFQLTSCLDRLRQEEGFVGLKIKGRRFDVGLPEDYRQTIIDYQNS